MNKEILLDRLENMSNRELKEFYLKYLPLLADSIKIQYDDQGMEHEAYGYKRLLDEFRTSKGWGGERSGSNWHRRCQAWSMSALQHTQSGVWLAAGSTWKAGSIPIFLSKAVNCVTKSATDTEGYNYKKLVENSLPTAAAMTGQATTSGRIQTKTTNKSNTPKGSPMKNTLNKMLETNKEAAHIAAKLSAGKVSNNFVLGKLMSAMPWYTKLFSKKRDLVENPMAKLVTAQTAAAAIAQFAPTNKKLEYLADAMVQDAMLDVTYNSGLLEDLVKELENLVKLPDSLGKE